MFLMSKIFDAHVHLNLSSENPVEELIARLEAAGICQAVLILNQQKEIDALRTDYLRLKEHFGNRICLAIFADPKTEAPFREADYWRTCGFQVFTKLHPRITGITVHDFPQICQMLQQDPSPVIIIDCLGYGHHIEHHIGIELGILLAQTFPQKKIVLAHAGGERMLQCLLYTRTLPNIFYDISCSCNYFFQTSVHADMVQLLRFNVPRVMYGSDYPDFLPENAIKHTNILCEEAGLNEAAISAVFSKNAERIYGNL